MAAAFGYFVPGCVLDGTKVTSSDRDCGHLYLVAIVFRAGFVPRLCSGWSLLKWTLALHAKQRKLVMVKFNQLDRPCVAGVSINETCINVGGAQVPDMAV